MSSTAAPAGLDLVRAWCSQALEALGAEREEIDALNVYPVPDGDTGTNLYLTLEAAHEALCAGEAEDAAGALHAMGHGALLGARGNSGVILAQLLRAAAESLAVSCSRSAGSDTGASAQTLAEALQAAAAAGYRAVGTPVEGTMLTVAREAGEAAARAAGATGSTSETIAAAASEARMSLQRTPDLLPALAAACVVDAGGRGVCVLLDVAETVLTGVRRVSIPVSIPLSAAAGTPGGTPAGTPGSRPVSAPVGSAARRHLPVPTVTPHDAGSGPSAEVMYLLDAADDAVEILRQRLARLGDSLVVVGGDGLWNVHVHVDDVGAAIEAGIEAGRPHRIQVTHLADHARDRLAPPQGSRGVVAVAAGPGLRALFAEAGAQVVAGVPGRRCSTAELLAAIKDTDAAEVVVLPNDVDSVAVAEAAARAAREEGIRVAVIPTRAQVQGLAAVAVHDPGRGFDDDVVAMTAAAGHAHHGAVTVAARDAMTMAGPCSQGDALGVIDGDFAVVGEDLRQVAVTVLDRLLGGGGEMVTVVRGADCADALVGHVVDHLRTTRPDVDVVVHDGGQRRYPLLVAVE